MTKRLIHLLAAAGFGLALAAGGAQAADTIRVGSKIDTEGALLGNMIVLLLQKAGFTVESKVQLGPTKIVRQAILAGELDVYPEYTGNAAFFFSMEDDPAFKNARTAYEKAKTLDMERNKLVWLKPAPANNTWAIALRKDVASQNRLRTLDDFGKWVAGGGKVKLAGSAEFVESAAALPAFQKAYGFKLTSDQLLVLSGGDTAATIKAAAEGTSGVNAAMAYGTDGALAAVGLVVMEDTKGAQVVYEPAPLVRAAVIEKNPAIRDLLEPVFASLTLETLQGLNARIQVEGQDARAVARDYLQAKGFLN
ncbi:ABC transporter substrate-binding protein [Chelatococcus sp. SYSU_G07232]|uniref:ABC transporter substrate-binding protein n=1 Tax=Chelatococcus albus TaxID=3047466 RepID=A0ABT7AIC9_9HYPH|nr:ABC transporter substrate-binding protein [Chelatococcus sp. SYSU_G07232]MDJ1159135.1 ABC transporter substrate-binding protein [Chelatococcus sp. SYSU_G07232]